MPGGSNDPVTLRSALERRKADLGHQNDTQVAAHVGVDQSTVTRWMAGSRPRRDQYPRLADYLNVSEEELAVIIHNTPRNSTNKGRIERLEADVADMRAEISEIRDALRRVAPPEQ